MLSPGLEIQAIL